MAKYDVYPNPDGPGFVLDVQADLLEALNTRVVVPLLPSAMAPTPARRLNPVFVIKGADFTMMTQYMSAVPRAMLRTPQVSLKDQFSAITDAIDMLVQGF